jgi:D-alanyl-lipoteichoic acid acyltransferase DltB (MBOAT superfamily)
MTTGLVAKGQQDPGRSSGRCTGIPAGGIARKGSDGKTGRLAEFLGLALVFVQVALVALIFHELHLETPAFRGVLYLVAGGFVAHHFLPAKWRLMGFILLSLAVTVLVLSGSPKVPHTNLGLGLARTAVLLGFSVVVIGICRLPLGFWKRAGLLLLAGGMVAAFRGGIFESGNLAAVWPVLASMFMFRVMVYLYDSSTSPQRPSLVQSLAYFTLLPNVCSLLFPVVDFRTFGRNYYDEEALLIYQRGAKWMARGTLHLILYHFVDLLLALKPETVASGTDLVRFVVANAFLYLQVSGLFHLCVGMLLLFGFNLPETNHRYFLASSFTDYWRRTNIYWRSFIMKVFYYPAYFRFKKIGQVKALVLATLWSFFVTWALHLYQTWWLKGSVDWAWDDAIFWTLLCVLVLANSLWELKRGRQRTLAAGRYGMRKALGLALRTAGTFGVISVLWSFWSIPTFGEWLHLWSLADRSTLWWGGAVLAGIMAATLWFETRPALAAPATAGLRRDQPAVVSLPRLGGQFLRHVVPLFAIFASGHFLVNWRADRPAPLVLADARTVTHILTMGGISGQGQGYYENLVILDQANRQYGETIRRASLDSGLTGFKATHVLDGPPFRELTPNLHREAYGVDFETNSFGMRDREHTPTKPPGTYRIALLGSSHVMGFGLPAKDMFKTILEERLNVDSAGATRFELLNFAVPGMSPAGDDWILEHHAAQFSPDLVIFVAHSVDMAWIGRDVVWTVKRRQPFPAGFPIEDLSQADITTRTNGSVAEVRLEPFDAQMLSFFYARIVREARRLRAVPVWVYLPVPRERPVDAEQLATMKTAAADAGFLVDDLSELYSPYTPAELSLGDRWGHSNAKANGLIAAELYNRLVNDARIDLPGLSAHAGSGGASSVTSRQLTP